MILIIARRIKFDKSKIKSDIIVTEKSNLFPYERHHAIRYRSTIMSRTEKVHTHKSPGVRFSEASRRAKIKATRSANKSEMRKMNDPDDLVFVFENRRRNRPPKIGSAGYLDPALSEGDLLKKLLATRQAAMKDVHPDNLPGHYFIDNALYKDIINRAKQKKSDFKGARYQAMILLSEKELAESVHRFYASKGLKGRTANKN